VGKSGNPDAVNKSAALIRREKVWLPKSYTDPNTRMENHGEVTFSMLLTATGVSDLCAVQGQTLDYIAEMDRRSSGTARR
jgi:hypothetical protein